MSIVKTFRFPVTAEWWGDRILDTEAPGKPGLRVVTPPEFKGGIEGHWSPEELLVNAVASCYALTLVAIARRFETPIHRLHIDAVGEVEQDRSGHYRFLAVELEVELRTEPGSVEVAQKVAALAERHCIVGAALDAPVHVRVSIPRPEVDEAEATALAR
jgi:organic hydroperoxide reductase OsmC/OhrA